MPDLKPSDLAAYFDRVRYAGGRSATFGTLRDLHLSHARAIPFENLDILLGRGIRLDLPAIVQKIVHARRGGYCFEQNALFGAVLRALGFAVTPLLARVRWQLPPETPTALTHQLLLVETPDAGSCLADVGFGSMSLLTPVRLEFDREQPGILEPRRLVQRGRAIAQQVRIGDTWHDVYQFLPDEALAIDFELGNWFTCTHPQSRFTQNLVVARPGEGVRHSLLNRELATRHSDGRVEKHTITSVEELLAVLAARFDLHFPPETRFRAPGGSAAPWPT
jgi:N-hydroxyarylamine O-acetyltransferase